MTPQLCPKTITIYHIPTHKVGSSSNLKKRMSNQGYAVDDCELLHTIEPDTMTYRAIWELECSEQARLGYAVEKEQHWQIFLQSHTNNIANEPEVRAKKSATMSDGRNTGANHPHFGRKFSDETRAKMSASMSGRGFSDEHRAKLSAAKSGGQMSGRKGNGAKVANIYQNGTDELVAEHINISEWCRENGYGQANLATTARAERSRPSTAKNPHHHKNLYARYIPVEVL